MQERYEFISNTLKEQIYQVLNSENNEPHNLEINPNMSFIQLGLNSLGLTDFASLVNRRLGTKISIEIIFEYCSLDELTNYILALR